MGVFMSYATNFPFKTLSIKLFYEVFYEKFLVRSDSDTNTNLKISIILKSYLIFLLVSYFLI